MLFYLSSYKLGGEQEVARLISLLPDNKRTAYIANALDFSTDIERRKQSEQADINDLQSLGLEVENFDLKKYFHEPEKLASALNAFGVIWVRGGNTFVLRQAMQLSGFDVALHNLVKKNADMLYGGYSAGICVLTPSLKGLELVDDVAQKPYPEAQETIWDGLKVIDYAIVPHYKSDHPESELVDRVVAQYEQEGVKFVALRDGEVIIKQLS